MINIIIFSCDRASQLELLLSSMDEHWTEAFEHDIKILYTYSNDNFKKGYDILMEEYDDVSFIKENNFKKDLLNLLENKKYTIFFVDDIIFKENFSLDCKEFKVFEEQKDILCLSLRLHPNLIYCYAAGIPMRKPIFKNNIWEWFGKDGDWGYPMSIDGNLWRTNEIKEKLEKLNYTNPNSMEGTLANNPINLPKMICFDNSKILNNPCNKVQTNNPNRHGTVTAEYINEKFLNGLRIKNNANGMKNISCHQEIPVIFYKK